MIALARVQVRLGRRSDAAASYARFLEILENADPNLPSLDDAREGLARNTDR